MACSCKLTRTVDSLLASSSSLIKYCPSSIESVKTPRHHSSYSKLKRGDQPSVLLRQLSLQTKLSEYLLQEDRQERILFRLLDRIHAALKCVTAELLERLEDLDSQSVAL
jgi:DNA-binding Xre family transcriptional regulator